MYGVRGGRPVRRRFIGNHMRMRKGRIYLILILRRGSPFPVVKPKEHRSLMWATGRRIAVLNERGNCWSYWGRQNQVGAHDGKLIVTRQSNRVAASPFSIGLFVVAHVKP